METNRKLKDEPSLPVIQPQQPEICSFNGYNADTLMKETAKLRKLITRRGTLEILIPLCCTTNPVRHKELEKSRILERQRYNEIPPRVEYRLTNKRQELVESIIGLMQWMQKWSKSK